MGRTKLNKKPINSDSLLTKHIKRTQKAELREFILQSLASLIITITLTLQFLVGAWHKVTFSSIIGRVFGLLFLIILFSLLFYPKINMLVFNKALNYFGRKVFKLINTVILSSFYLLTLLPARILGRRKLLSLRSELTPWVKRSTDWKISTWRRVDFEPILNQKTGFLRGLLYVFLRERNIFLLVMLIILLIISMFILFAQSSVVAPFIYTII